MNWTLQIPRSVRRQIRLWGNVYPALPAIFYQRLQDELTQDPDAHLGEMIPPTMTRRYGIVVNGVDGIPDGLVCRFYIDRYDGSRTLEIISARMSTPGRHG